MQELESLRFRMLSSAPIYPTLEEARMTASLTEAQAQLGAKVVCEYRSGRPHSSTGCS